MIHHRNLIIRSPLYSLKFAISRIWLNLVIGYAEGIRMQSKTKENNGEMKSCAFQNQQSSLVNSISGLQNIRLNWKLRPFLFIPFGEETIT